MKAVVLLAIALFLVSAPAPDSRDIAEMTSNFIVPEQAGGLQADEARVTPGAAEESVKIQHESRGQAAVAEASEDPSETVHEST